MEEQPWCHSQQDLLIVEIMKHGGNFWIAPHHGTTPIHYLTTPEISPLTLQEHVQ